MQNPNLHIGKPVQVTISPDQWFIGTIMWGDATVVKVKGPEEYPELTTYYPIEQVELIETQA